MAKETGTLASCVLSHRAGHTKGKNHRLIQARNNLGHGLSQQGVWMSFWTPKPLKSTHQDTQILLRGIS